MLDSSIHRMKFKEYYIEHIKFMCVDLFEFLEDVGLIHLTSNQFVVLKLRHLLFLFLKFLWICLKICFWLFAIFPFVPFSYFSIQMKRLNAVMRSFMRMYKPSS